MTARCANQAGVERGAEHNKRNGKTIEQAGGNGGGVGSSQTRQKSAPRGKSRQRQNRQYNYEQARSTRHAGRPADSRKIRDASLFLATFNSPMSPKFSLLYKFCFRESTSHVAKLYSQLKLTSSPISPGLLLNFTSSHFRYFRTSSSPFPIPSFPFSATPVVLVLSHRMDSRCSGRRWEPRRRRRARLACWGGWWMWMK